jgi:hypothetical protein
VKPAGGLGRDLFLAEVARVQDWPGEIEQPDPYFVLFVAADVREIDDDVLDAFARKLLTQGAACVCAWGFGCERTHDRFDWVEIDRNPGFDDEDVILTSVHEDESLDEALWYALFTAWPAPKYEDRCDATLAIAVGDDEWAEQIRRRMGDPAQFIDEL